MGGNHTTALSSQLIGRYRRRGDEARPWVCDTGCVSVTIHWWWEEKGPGTQPSIGGPLWVPRLRGRKCEVWGASWPDSTLGRETYI